MNNPSNISANPRFSVLEFAKSNSPRGDFLFSQQLWNTTQSAPLVFQPPTNTGNGEVFFVKEIHLLIKAGSSLGNNMLFQIYQKSLNPPIMMSCGSLVDLMNSFDVIANGNFIANPEDPNNANSVYQKFILIFPVPLQIRSSINDKFEVRLTNATNTVVSSGIGAGEIRVSAHGWRILESSY